MVRAKFIMRNGAAVKPVTTAKDVVSRLSAMGLPGLAVVNNELDILGVITEFDILGALREGMKLDSFTAERVMTKNPLTADVNTTAHELIKLMLLNNYTVIPILNNGKFAGVVSRLAVLDSYESSDYDVFHDK